MGTRVASQGWLDVSPIVRSLLYAIGLCWELASTVAVQKRGFRGKKPVPKLWKMSDTVQERQAIIDFAEEYLDSNPGRIKRLLNTYRYVKILAARCGRKIDDAAWQKRMIAWLGASMRWPTFMKEAITCALVPGGIDSWTGPVGSTPKESCPPDNVLKLLPRLGELAQFTELADNFIKERELIITAFAQDTVSLPQERTGHV